MASLDTAIANTALPTIARDLQASDAGSIWVISGYPLAMVAGLLPAAAPVSYTHLDVYKSQGSCGGW